jgi:hypothetical protein
MTEYRRLVLVALMALAMAGVIRGTVCQDTLIWAFINRSAAHLAP